MSKSSRKDLSSSGRLCEEGTPITGSIAIIISSPLSTFQARWLPSQGRVCKKPFHIVDTPRVQNLLPLSQATTVRCFKYLLVSTRCHNPSFNRTLQNFLRCRAMLNQFRFFILQPSYSFGHERLCQFTKWYLRLFSVDPHKKANVMILSLCSTKAGIGANPNQ